MSSIGAPELLIILAVVLLIFGGSRLPSLARSLGRAQKEFKQGLQDGASDEAGKTDSTAEKRNDERS